MFGKAKSKPQKVSLRVQGEGKRKKGEGGVVVSDDLPGMVLVCAKPERLEALLTHYVSSKAADGGSVTMKTFKMNWKKGQGEASYVIEA